MKNKHLADEFIVKPLNSSFRDPAGFLYKDIDGSLCRQINNVGLTDYKLLVKSGLYDDLIKKSLLINHIEIKKDSNHIIIKPKVVNYISYPFEWSFSQLKDAALTTLKIQANSLKYGMTLKDASAYNIQFLNGKPIFIDTLSFEKYKSYEPWQAYRQFCQHFLAPLVLMSYTDIDLQQLLRVYIDGIPLDLAKKLLPQKAKIKPSIYMHIVLHAKAQKTKAKEHKKPNSKVSKSNLLAIIDNLERTIKKLNLRKQQTEWQEYYDNTNYSTNATDDKVNILSSYVKPLKIKSAIDFGGNSGRYSRVLNKLDVFTVCTDIDPNAVEANYLYSKNNNENRMLPLLIDLTNPGGALGWDNQERQAIDERLKMDLSMALALIHHLAISNNLTFDKIAQYFIKFSNYLIIEFIPKDDSQVKKLLSTRKDIFCDYNEKEFKKTFSKYYKIVKEQAIKGSKRKLYLLEKK